MWQFPLWGNFLFRYGKRLGIPLLLVICIAATSKHVVKDDAWTKEMDTYIKSHLQEGMFHICYQSINNSLTQYYRNANLPIPSVDVIKLPIVYEVLSQVNKRELDLNQTAIVTQDRIRQNKEGFFGPEDVGKSFSLEKIVEATLTFNDNAAANVLLEIVGYQNIVERLRQKDLSNTYIKHPLVDSLKNNHLGTTNFVTSGDMMHLLKRIYSEKKSKNKDWLIQQLQQNAQKNLLFGMDGTMVAGISENTRLAKGFIALVEDKTKGSYYITMFVSNFKSESAGDKFLQDMVYIFNGGTIKTDSIEEVKKGGGK